ncbi:hypothetical protein ACB092_08G191800 [Castanea dentata]
MDFQLQSMIEFHAKHQVNQHLLPVGRKMRSELQTGGGFAWCWESVCFRRALFLQRHCAMALNMDGPWSDSSPEWTDRMKHKLKHVPQDHITLFPYYTRGVLCGFTFLSFIFS